jgi:hypothetical protein
MPTEGTHAEQLCNWVSPRQYTNTIPSERSGHLLLGWVRRINDHRGHHQQDDVGLHDESYEPRHHWIGDERCAYRCGLWMCQLTGAACSSAQMFSSLHSKPSYFSNLTLGRPTVRAISGSFLTRLVKKVGLVARIAQPYGAPNVLAASCGPRWLDHVVEIECPVQTAGGANASWLRVSNDDPGT